MKKQNLTISNCKKSDLLLYAITNRFWLQEQSLAHDVEIALKNGVTMLQLREKDLPDANFMIEAQEIKKLCNKYHVPFIINDNVNLAIACDSDGVHIGQSDLNVEIARAKLGPNKIIGVSAHTVEQAIIAEKQGADYLGVGAVFPTSTKKTATSLPLKTLKDICNTVSIPVCAIGGISTKNIDKLIGTGIDGISVISAIFGASNIAKACNELVELSKKVVQR